jgi:hypothetical protein
MTIGNLLRGDLILHPIPATGERAMTVQEPPAALPEGVAAGVGAKHRPQMRRPEQLAMAAVAVIDEIEEIGELLTGRDRI